MKKSLSERLEDVRMALEAMSGELFDIACELPYGSADAEAILRFRSQLASLLKAGFPQISEETEEDEDVAA
jgi:hypothetical protein